MIDKGYAESERYTDGIRVESAGHIFAKQGRKIHRPYGRDDYLLFLVAAGEETMLFHTGEERAKMPSFVIYAPEEPQLHFCHSETAEFYYVHFRLEQGRSLSAFSPFATQKVHRLSSLGRLPSVLESMIEEVQLQEEGYEKIAVYRFLELFSLLERQTGALTKKNANLALVNRVIHHITRTYESGLSLDDYAREAGVSKFYLTKLFKSQTGESLIAYRNRLRMRRASYLLEEGRLTVAQVGEAVGFSSAVYFSDCFTKENGCSPTEYRKRRML